MMHTNRLVIVEGKYDKIKLESVLDALIITTDGFSIFKDKAKREFVKNQALKNGILILTDSDAAGFTIRNHIASFVPAECILNAYIPDIEGKEKRKDVSSKEGKLGVEGMKKTVLKNALKKAGIEETEVAENHTLSYDLYRHGLYGKPEAREKRAKLLKRLGLPQRLSQNNLLKYINRNFSKNEFEKIMEDENV
ncbi:MAG: DUF4093 domain-containing protein [Clostridia bacterium]|nr:DUF4093 domain-containing protein [Clostridia bacterium]